MLRVATGVKWALPQSRCLQVGCFGGRVVRRVSRVSRRSRRAERAGGRAGGQSRTRAKSRCLYRTAKSRGQIGEIGYKEPFGGGADCGCRSVYRRLRRSVATMVRGASLGTGWGLLCMKSQSMTRAYAHHIQSIHSATLIIHICDFHREVGASNAKAQVACKTGSHGHGATAT